jgi:hypothetical protein
MVGQRLDRSIPVARRNYDMQATVKLPKAFSVRDEHELFPMQLLMARMNPRLMVVQVATGRHVSGGCTVPWGLVYLEGQRLTREDVEDAWREAGFNFTHNALHQVSSVWESIPGGTAVEAKK